MRRACQNKLLWTQGVTAGARAIVPDGHNCCVTVGVPLGKGISDGGLINAHLQRGPGVQANGFPVGKWEALTIHIVLPLCRNARNIQYDNI